MIYCRGVPIFIPDRDDAEDGNIKYMLMSYNKIFVYQMEIIKIFMNYEFDNKTANEIINDYLIDCKRMKNDEKFEINYKI